MTTQFDYQKIKKPINEQLAVVCGDILWSFFHQDKRLPIYNPDPLYLRRINIYLVANETSSVETYTTLDISFPNDSASIKLQLISFSQITPDLQEAVYQVNGYKTTKLNPDQEKEPSP